MEIGWFPFWQASLGASLQGSTWNGVGIVAVLVVGSVMAWTLMLTKWRELRTARLLSDAFMQAYRGEAHPIGLALRSRRFAGSPLYVIYEHVCQALGRLTRRVGMPEDGDLFGGDDGTGRMPDLTTQQTNAVRNVAERTVADEALLLETSMGLLATAVTTAPLLGLLGTVWGVMDAFAGMSAQKSAQLSAVAPGISSALVTTVVGLIVALPSAIGYNLLSNEIRKLCVKMDNFAQELVSDIETRYLASTR